MMTGIDRRGKDLGQGPKRRHLGRRDSVPHPVIGDGIGFEHGSDRDDLTFLGLLCDVLADAADTQGNPGDVELPHFA